MAAKRFKSKIDRWILVVLILSIMLVVMAMIAVARQPGDPVETTIVIFMFIGIIGLIVWPLVSTYYMVHGNTLRIVAGPFRWRIAIDTITTVEATRSPWSSPALSMDRLRLRYGNNRCVLISPADKTGFLRAIGHDKNA